MNFVYITTNKINGKQYVGSHSGDISDGYLGSGKILKYAIKKYGRENFERKIIRECLPEENLILEEKYIKKYKTLDPNGYNISETGGYLIYTEDLKNKLSKSRKKHSGPNKGKKFSEETRIKMSNSAKIRKRYPLSEETKQKIKEGNLGKKISEITRKRISNSLTGRKLSEEAKIKVSNFQRGRIKSEEECKNISESKKGKKNPMYGKPPWNKGLKKK